jgi:hypothetical protein
MTPSRLAGREAEAMMTSPHLSEDDLVLHYYGELAPADEQAAAGHLEACAACRGEFNRLRQVLVVISEESVAEGIELPPSFERTVWARLEPALPRDRRRWRAWLFAPAPLAFAATVVVLVIGSFLAGRSLAPVHVAPPSGVPSADDRVRERILLVDLGEHLDRSQMVLVELASHEGEAGADVSVERARAEELVANNRLYRRTAEETGNVEISELLDEIERVLTEVAAGPAEMSAQDLADVRRRIESGDLLFKVRVVSSEVRERQRESLRRRAGQRS